MVTLLQAQKNVSLTPVVNVSIGGTSYNGKVGRYKYREKADSFGRASIWLDNTGGTFDNLSGTPIKRGAEVILSRGVKTATGQELTADLPSVWIESMIYTFFRDQPYLVLDCIDWVGRLRYFRYASETTWTNTAVKTIASDLLANVGLTLASGSFSTALSIDFTISPRRSGWSALRAVMAKVPEVLYAKTGGEIGWKTLDPNESASYSFDLNPGTTSDDHPLLDDSDVAESSARYNSITVVGGPDLEFSGTAEDAGEISLMGYRRRRYITDRTLGSGAECAARAQAELDFWLARSQAGVIVARPHFTARLFDVISAPAPLWGGPAVGAGHVTRIVEWFNYGSQDYAQALTIGEVPDAAITAIGDDTDPIPVGDDDPDEADTGSGEDSGASDGEDDEGTIETTQLADDSVTAEKIAALPSARVYHNATQSTSDQTETFLSFNTERWDTDNIHNVSTNNGRLTCKTPGKYLVTGHISMDYASVGSGTAFLRVDLVLNTGTVVATQTATRLSTIDEDLQITVSAILDLSVDDYVRVRVYQAGIGTVNVLAGSSTNQQNADFEIHYLGG